MTPTEFKNIKNYLGLSYPKLAEKLGVKSERTLKRYASTTKTKTPIPGPVAKLMWYLYVADQFEKANQQEED